MAQKVIDDVLTLTTPKMMMAAIDDNFDELYAADVTLDGRVDTLDTLVGNLPTPFGINVLDFGAVGNGTTDDTAAIQAAINSLSSTGGIVYLPSGTYKVSSALVMNTTGITLLGANRNSTIISGSNATQNIIEIGSLSVLTKGNRVSNLQITSSVAKTAGAAIKVFSGHQTDLDHITLMNNMYYGFQFEAGPYQYIYHLTDFEVNSGLNAIIVGHDTATYPGVVQELVCTDGTIASQTGLAIRLEHIQGAFFRNIDIISSQTGVGMVPGNGQVVVACWFDTVLGDTCGNNGWTLQPSGTGIIKEIMMVSCWGASCVNYGMLIDSPVAGRVSGVALTGCRFMHNQKHGLYISDKVQAVSISNVHCLGNSTAASATYHGVYLESGVDGVSLIGGVSGVGGLFTNYQGYGVYFAGTATNCAIVGMNVCGNLTGAIRESGVAAGNGLKITSCIGHITENSGLATVANGTSSIVVPHGLNSTPGVGEISCTCTVNPTACVSGGFFYWVSDVTSTTFKINTSATLTIAAAHFAWQILTR